MRMGIQTVRPLALSAIMFTVLLIGGILFPRAATAATYYVALTGNNASSGTQALPFQTIGKGLSVLAAGDTLYIRGGTYNEDITNSNGLAASGTSWSNPITIAGYPGETVVARTAGLNTCGFNYIIFKDLSLTRGAGGAGAYCDLGSATAGDQYVRFQNLNVYGWVSNNHGYFIFANHVEIIGGNVHDPAAFTDHSCDSSVSAACHGIYLHGGYNLIDGVTLYNVTGFCIHQYGQYPNTPNSNSIIRNNIIHDCGIPTSAASGGILTSGGGSGNIAQNNLVYNNIVYNIPLGAGIGVAYNNANTQVYNNTIYNTGDANIVIDGSSTTGTIVRNNIVYSQGIRDTATNSNIDHNLTTNPLFVNASAADFHLQATSPAIDAGISIGVVTVDMQSTPRPQGAGYDIGAYEYSGLQLPTPQNFRTILVTP